jgi:hypothetical protein
MVMGVVRHRHSAPLAVGRHLAGWGAAGLLFLAVTIPASADQVFLQDGRTIQADKVEVVGDRVRIERPGGAVDLPRSEVLSIHPVSPPSGTPGLPSPADTYHDLTNQMTDKVRREIQAK